MPSKIKKGDQVVITKGKDKAKTGNILKVLPDEGKVVVEGMNMAIKHARPRKRGEDGQRVSIAQPIDRSNVKLICPSCGEAVRVGFKEQSGDKIRKCKSCNKTIE